MGLHMWNEDGITPLVTYYQPQSATQEEYASQRDDTPAWIDYYGRLKQTAEHAKKPVGNKNLILLGVTLLIILIFMGVIK